jgi:hypothetical protein
MCCYLAPEKVKIYLSVSIEDQSGTTEIGTNTSQHMPVSLLGLSGSGWDICCTVTRAGNRYSPGYVCHYEI